MGQIVDIHAELFKLPLKEVLSDAMHGDHTHFELITVTVKLDNGALGTGYTYTGGRGGRAILAMIEYDLIPFLIGKNADNVEEMFKTMGRTYKPTAFPDGDVDAQVVRPLQTSGPSLAISAPGGRAPPKEHVRGTTQCMKLICPGAGNVEGSAKLR